MSIPRYRIGNDLTVLWAINNKDGSPYDLSQKEVRLFVTHPRDKIEVEATIQTLQGGVINNVIRWDFSGLEQRVLGKYMLTAEIYTSENKKLIRKDISEAFALVSRSEMENEEGGDEVMDGGDLYLSSALDIYRFGIPKVRIGTDGFWYIDGVKTGVSALGGGPGLVKNIYTETDFSKTFDSKSVIDTFNAYAVASLEKRIKFLEGDFYTQVRNLTDVLLRVDPQPGQALVWDGTYWTAKEVATKGESGGGLSDAELKIFKELQKLLTWFSLDEDNNMIKAHHGLYSFGPLVAGGKIQEGFQPSEANHLHLLMDVNIDNPKGGESLVYDEDSLKWVNKLIEGGEGGGASLGADVTAGVKVGNISVGALLEKGMTFTEFVEMMFSQGVKIVPPAVSLAGVPSQPIEVGSNVILNITSSFGDGYFSGTDEGKTNAGCQPGDASFSLDNEVVKMPYTFTADEPMIHTIKVAQPYGASTVKPVKGGQELTDSIPAGTADESATFVVGYRAFWGYMTDEEAESLTSELVRDLEHRDTIINPTQNSISLLNAENIIPAGEDLVIAMPEGYALGEVIDKTTAQPIKFETPKTLAVDCGNITKNYRVYRYDNYNDDAPMYITKITIVKEA